MHQPHGALHGRIIGPAGHVAGVRVAAHHHHLAGGEGEGHRPVLVQEGALAGQGAQRDPLDVFALPPHGTGGRRHLPADGAQQGGFARTVGAEHRQQGAGAAREAHIVQQHRPPAAHLHRYAVHLQHHTARDLRRRTSRYRNTGAPHRAVITPMGISAGAAMVRARVSARHSSSAPASMEAGIT